MQFDNYVIRLLTEKDAEKYFTLVENNRKRLEDFFSGTVAKTKTVKDTKNFLTELMERIVAKTFFPYGIIDKDTNEIIGYMHVMNLDWNIPKAEIGFFIDADFAGKGIITKALTVLMDYYFETLQFNKLFLRTHKTNIAARALAEKCGFEIEGTLRKDYKTTSGELVDLIYYGKIK